MTAEQRLSALAGFDRVWIDSLKRDVQFERFHTGLLLRAVLTGSELTILGKPVRIDVTWPEGPPDGMTNQQIADAAAAWYPAGPPWLPSQ